MAEFGERGFHDASISGITRRAGVALGSAIDGGSYEDLEWIMNINFWGVVRMTRAFLPLLEKIAEKRARSSSGRSGSAAIATAILM